MNLDKYRNMRRRVDEDWINVHPIQRGGVLPPESKEAMVSFADGYSVCDYCLEGRVDLVQKPPVADFKADVAEFLNMDEVRFTPGARGAQQALFRAMTEPGDAVILDSLAHYTSYISAEINDVDVVEVPHTGYPEFKIKPGGYRSKIEMVVEETGELPALVLLTHVDYRYGNLADAKEVGEIAEEYGVPFVLNAAYTAGIMLIDGKKLKADFVIGSGHKSWAASGPIGILATSYVHSDQVFDTSSIKGSWSGRAFAKKEVNLYGCSPVFGVPIITLMASFPHVYERVKHWGEEVEKTRWLVDELERIRDFHQLGERPRRHTLFSIEVPSFHEISKEHKRGGFFLYEELKDRKISGVHPGLTKQIKLNTYGLDKEDIEEVANAFHEIAEEYGVEVE